ncbi:hypothetical protein AADG42_08045 [Ammonicoccus fulvus]|uniref:Hsp70 family protein n=1 Tax=Ammonicoccus fulvus TaxID=3138240 RepID=A0ABZ3FME8_9ACTN
MARHPFTGAAVATLFGSDTPSSLDGQHRTPSEIVVAEIDRLLAEHAPELGLVLVPDTWGSHRLTLLADHLGGKVAIANETPMLLELTRDSERSPADGATVLVVRVGSETTSASVHEDSDEGWLTCHHAETDWGGDDLDDLMVSFVRTRLLDDIAADVVRHECRLARERLSSEIHADVCGVRIHRADLDGLAREGLMRALRGTLTSVLQELPAPPDRIWLAGGVTAMPLVAQLVSEVADRPVRLLEWTAVTAPSATRSTASDDEHAAEETVVLPALAASPARVLSGATVVDLASRARPRGAADHRRRFRLVGLIAAGVALVAFAGAAFLQPGGAGAVLGFMIGSGSTQPNPAGPPPAHAATRGPAATPAEATPEQSAATASPGSPELLANQVPAGGTPAAPQVDSPATPAPTEDASVPTTEAPAAGAPAADAPAPGAAPPPARTTGAAPPPAPAPVPAPTTRPAPAPPATTEAPPPPPPPAPTTQAPAEPPVTQAPPADPTEAAAERSAAESTGDSTP